MTSLPQRRSAVTLFFDEADWLILAVSRKDDHEDLGLPGGKVEPHETFTEAAIRETLEETGVRSIMLHEVFKRQCGEFDARTFRVTAWEGWPRAMEEAAVLWVPPERLLEESCSFRDYNLALFESLGILNRSS